MRPDATGTPRRNRTRTRLRDRARRALTAAAVVVVAGALAACASIPTSGAVMDGEAVVEAPGPVYLRANSPRVGAPPDQIVQGFLAAQVSGATGTFDVAAEFLTPTSAEKWVPLAQVAVLASEPSFQVDDAGGDPDTATVRATADLVGVVDTRGVYTEQVPGTTTELVYDLVRGDDDQWRIASTDDGLVMTSANFDRTYRATNLYFPTSDRIYLVPDQRWFPRRNWQTLAVRETLAGPVDWLGGSVATVTPDGTALSIDSVTVDANGGPVTVPLTDAASAMSPEDRSMLIAQLEASLGDPAPRTVQLAVGSATLGTGQALDIGPAVTADDPVVLDGDRISTLDGREVEAIDALPALTGLQPTALAFRGPSGSATFVVRDGGNRLVAVPPQGKDRRTLLTGEDLLAPSLDRLGLVWSGPQLQDGSLQVVDLDGGDPVTVPAPWLADAVVVSVRVSPDGARLAVVSRTDAGLRVDVAGVVRDENGVPTQLSDPVRVGEPVVAATQVAWVDTTMLGVLGRVGSDDAPRLQLVPVGGPTSQASPLENAVAVASGPGVSSVLLGTSDASLYSAGSSTLWTRVATEVRIPTYPG